MPPSRGATGWSSAVTQSKAGVTARRDPFTSCATSAKHLLPQSLHVPRIPTVAAWNRPVGLC